MSSSIPEDITLIGDPTGETFWRDRLSDWDEVNRAGETFLLNSHVTPTPTRRTQLVPPDSREQVASWLRSSTPSQSTGQEDDDGSASDGLLRSFGLSWEDLPAAHEGWRFSTELYLIAERAVYLTSNRRLIRGQSLTPAAYADLLAPSCLPFADEEADPNSGVIVVVGVPNRQAAIGGLRGYRSALLECGAALMELQMILEGRVEAKWHSQFYDERVSRILELDGLERFIAGIATVDRVTEAA
ncbi:nitroreductase family protein [Kytococcus sp. Marseille-QA3725]